MSTKSNDGGAAFPYCAEYGHPAACGGMSLLDYFAAHADIPWDAAMETLRLRKKNTGNTAVTIEELMAYRAKLKYMEADMMLAEKAKRGTP